MENEQARAIYQRMQEKLTEIEDLSGQLRRVVRESQDDPAGFERQLEWFVGSVQILSVDLTTLMEEPSPEHGLQAVTSYSAAASSTLFPVTEAGVFQEPEHSANAELRQTLSGVGSSVASIPRRIGRFLKSLGADLFQLLSKITDIKEWSVAGQAGVGLFGLNGAITLEVTFG